MGATPARARILPHTTDRKSRRLLPLRACSYAWTVVALLWPVVVLNYLDRQMLSTMGLSIKADIVQLQSAENFGWLMAIFLWVYAFCSPAGGFDADRFSRKWLIVATILCQVASARFRATGYGLLNFFGIASGALLTPLLGKLKDSGVPLAVSFAYCAVPALLAAVLMVLLRPKERDA